MKKEDNIEMKVISGFSGQEALSSIKHKQIFCLFFGLWEIIGSHGQEGRRGGS
jgi:hypothetical protein